MCPSASARRRTGLSPASQPGVRRDKGDCCKEVSRTVRMALVFFLVAVVLLVLVVVLTLLV